MNHRRWRALAAAVTGASMIMVGGARPASADILMTISDGNPADTQTFLGNSNNVLVSESTSIGNYSINAETVITNYPGSSFDGGMISTTVNILGTTGTNLPDTLEVTVQLVQLGIVNNAIAYEDLPWTEPSTSPLSVSAGTAFAANSTITSGSVTTETYFTSTSSSTMTGLGTGVVSADQTYNNVGGSPGPVTVSKSNPAGEFVLGQSLTLQNLNPGALGLVFTGTSTVNGSVNGSVILSVPPAAPEPSTMLIAGLGILGMIGYSFHRRRASCES